MKSLKQITKGKKYKTLSVLERNIVDILLLVDGLRFEANFPVGPYFVDIAFPKHKVGLEIDGHKYHSTDEARAKDQLRQEYLTEVKGWKIERVPGWFCYAEPEASVAKILRHIPEAQAHKIYLDGCERMKKWYVRDLLNRGITNRAHQVLGGS